MTEIANISAPTTTEISIRGRFRKVPAITINNTIIAIKGNLIRTGFIKGEVWLSPLQIDETRNMIDSLKKRKPVFDLFHFRQYLPDIKPKFDYPLDWSSIAAIPLTTYEDWWEKQASQVTRKNVRRSARRGIITKPVIFNDNLIESIVRINNDVPYRSGRKFWHFGKSFIDVKKDYSEYLDRSEFIGAYFNGELIGFLRLIYQGQVASIMQLLSMYIHYDKRPSNALIAKAVELCTDKKLVYLVYGQYVYDENVDNPITEFKRRNGFKEFLVPSYHVPFTLKGRIAILFNLHSGIKRLLPKRFKNMVRSARTIFYSRQKKAKCDDSSTQDY